MFTQVCYQCRGCAIALFTQGRQEEELVIAKAKVEEVTKKLALVKPDSIVLKNKEPRSVI